jgi:hypothetical protein
MAVTHLLQNLDWQANISTISASSILTGSLGLDLQSAGRTTTLHDRTEIARGVMVHRTDIGRGVMVYRTEIARGVMVHRTEIARGVM